MAFIYVRSTTGSNANNGSTWALAKATVVGALAIAVAGDTIYVSQVHAEVNAASTTWTFAAGAASPIMVICANDSAEPPTALATSATVSITTSSNFMLFSNYAYIYGISFTSSTTGGYFFGSAGNIQQYYDSCNFTITSGNTTPTFGGPGVSTSRLTFRNCGFKFGSTAQRFEANPGWCQFIGGSILAGGTQPVNFFLGSNTQDTVTMDGFDFSNGSSTMGIFSNISNQNPHTITNCKLPASWTGALAVVSSNPSRAEMIDCDSTNTNYRTLVLDWLGTLTSETTIVRTGGSSDGTTPMSWKMVSSANASWPGQGFVSPWMRFWNDTSGASKTITVEIIHDSLTALTDREVFVEVIYLGNASFPLGSSITDSCGLLTAAAAHPSSSETWTTTGLTNPNKQKLAVTLTPQQKGPFAVRVHLSKASYTAYIDRKPTVT